MPPQRVDGLAKSPEHALRRWGGGVQKGWEQSLTITITVQNGPIIVERRVERRVESRVESRVPYPPTILQNNMRHQGQEHRAEWYYLFIDIAVVFRLRVRVLHLHSLTSSSASHPSPTHHTSSAPATAAMPQLRESQVFSPSPSLSSSPSAAESRRVLTTPTARATGSGVNSPFQESRRFPT